MQNNHYVGNGKFVLFSEGTEPAITVGPNAFCDIPEAYHGDITYRKAVAAGVIQPFTPAGQGDAAERKAQEKARKAADDGKKIKDGQTHADAQNKDADAE